MENLIQKMIDEKADISAFIQMWESYKANKANSEKLNYYFKTYIINNKIFSVEDFFKITKWDRHSCGINFIPTSKSYEKYGSNVTIIGFVSTDEESEQYWNNWQNGKLTYGTFKAIKLPDPDKSPNGEEIEISTYDIYEIMHL